MPIHRVPLNLHDPAVMLETLHMAYAFMLDEVEFPDGSRLLPEDDSRRLDLNGQRELGYRLAEYRAMKASDLTGLEKTFSRVEKP